MRFVGDDRPVDLPVLQASKFQAESFSVGCPKTPSRQRWKQPASCPLEREDCTLVAWYCYVRAPHTGGAYDSHHRTARIAGRTRRRGGVAARGAGTAARETEARRRADGARSR